MKKFIVIVSICITAVMYAHEWQVKKTEKNLVKFISSTSLLDFEGTTNKIDGYIYWEGDSIFEENNELYFEIPINSIETGIGKRDRDMKETVLETHKFPTTFFKGKITEFSKTSNKEEMYAVTVSGEIFIHGVRKALIIPGKLSINNGEMKIQTDFSVFLKDYSIEAPSLMAFVKVAEEIKLHLEFYLIEVTR